jgi:hemolysin activation/secretion protein
LDEEGRVMTRTIRIKQGFITSTSLGAVAVACSLGLPGVVATTGLLAVSSPAHAQEAVSDGAYYGVSTFQLRLIPGDHPGLPSAEQLLSQATVALFETSGGWTSSAPVGDVAPTSTSVAALPSGNYSRGALQTIAESILGAVTADGIVGATVVIDSTMIGNDGADLRGSGQKPLRFYVVIGTVTEVRTLGTGSRVSEDERLNHPLHNTIRTQSPITPYAGGEGERNDLLRKDALDDYIFRLNRYPGRSVVGSLSAGDEPGDVVLDYLISENPSNYVYVGISNTGTESTNEWRERVGYVNTQLTDNDDMLTVEFITASFDETYAASAWYEAPWDDTGKNRWRVEGSWGEYTAGDVGLSNQEFTGKQWNVGFKYISNYWQDGNQFVDWTCGTQLSYANVANNFFGGILVIEGESYFINPHLGVNYFSADVTQSTQASVSLEFTHATASANELNKLGRLDPSQSWFSLQFDGFHSFYLEPWLDRAGWEDPTTWESSTLAHELQLSLQGQWAVGSRLVPQAEQTIGGMYTVRGYKESITAGDSVVIGSIEYRYHVPRAFAPEMERREFFGQQFKWAPQQVYGRPDWDLVLCGFVDAGHSWNNDRKTYEFNDTLIGIGIGAEVMFKQNFNMSVYWGFAMHDVDSAQVESGSSRVHIGATLLF